MIFSVILLAIMALGISGQSSTDTSLLTSLPDLLISIVGTVNSYNGPTSISEAERVPSNNALPSEEQLMYYNYYAQSAYCSDQLKDLSCDICQNFKSDINPTNGVAVLTNDLLNTLAYITVSNLREEIVVTFRGTVPDLRNFLLDATLFNPGVNNIKFHLGFYFATMSVYDDVIVSVGYQLQLHPTYKVVFVGHSLGGAMARLTVFFVVFRNQFPGVTIELYTYGEPRVGNKAFADYFNNLFIRSARCVNKDDLVPHLPPTSIIVTNLVYDYYVHPELEAWIQEDGSVRFCNPNFYEDPDCSNSEDPSYTATDHSTYFDVVGDCSEIVIPANLQSNPPSLPSKILNFLGGLLNFLGSLIS